LNNRGVGYMEKFDFGPAAAEFEKVVEKAPDWMPGHINLAIASYNKGGEDEAKKNKEVAGSKENEPIRRAISIFQHVLSKEPDNPYAHSGLGFLLLYKTRIEEAKSHFEAVVRVDPTDAGALYQLANCLDQLDRERERALIIELCERALRTDP